MTIRIAVWRNLSVLYRKHVRSAVCNGGAV